MATDKAEAQRRGLGRSHSTQYAAPDSKAGASMRGSLVQAMQQLRDDVQTQVLRSAVYAGAKLLADEMAVQANRIKDDGTILGALYTWHDDKRSRDGRQVYVVGVNKRQAGHWAMAEYGHMRVNVVIPGDEVANPEKYGKAFRRMADGTSVLATKRKLPAPIFVPATPYIRPTADRMPDAVRAMQRRLITRLREVRAGTDEGGSE